MIVAGAPILPRPESGALPLEFERIVSITAVETRREITPVEVASEGTPLEVEAISAIVAKAPIVITAVVIAAIIIEAAVIIETTIVAVIGEGIAIALPAKLLLTAIAIAELPAIVASVELLTTILRSRLLHIRGRRILLATAPELLPALAALAVAPVTPIAAAVRIRLLHVRRRGSLLGLWVLLAATTALPAALLLLLLGYDAVSILETASPGLTPLLRLVLLLPLPCGTLAERRLRVGRQSIHDRQRDAHQHRLDQCAHILVLSC